MDPYNFIKDVTWKRDNNIKTNFPNFPLQEYNVIKRAMKLYEGKLKEWRITFNSKD